MFFSLCQTCNRTRNMKSDCNNLDNNLQCAASNFKHIRLLDSYLFSCLLRFFTSFSRSFSGSHICYELRARSYCSIFGWNISNLSPPLTTKYFILQKLNGPVFGLRFSRFLLICVPFEIVWEMKWFCAIMRSYNVKKCFLFVSYCTQRIVVKQFQ